MEAGKQVFIRSQGVEALLKGKLHITGNINNPIVTGILKSERGQYREFGKLLKVKEGTLAFDGPLIDSPYLNIVGVVIEKGNEIRLILSGPIKEPIITIESTPYMSQEAALSMLLFGGNPEDISAFQALQIANSLRSLSSKGGKSIDIIAKSRKFLKVDDIKFKTDSKGTSVGVGKYLTDQIYVELEKDNSTGGIKSIVEIQMTPSISLENITEQSGSSFLGINWRFDY